MALLYRIIDYYIYNNVDYNQLVLYISPFFMDCKKSPIMCAISFDKSNTVPDSKGLTGISV